MYDVTITKEINCINNAVKLFETCKQVAVFKIGNLFLKRSINKLNMQIMSTTSTIKRSRNSLIKKRFSKKIKLNQKYVCFHYIMYYRNNHLGRWLTTNLTF